MYYRFEKPLPPFLSIEPPPLLVHMWRALVGRGSHGAIVVYDITSASSFERAKMWINELREHLGRKVCVWSSH